MARKGEKGPSALHAAYQQKYESAIKRQLFNQVLDAFNQQVLSLLLQGVEITLPYRLGTFYVEKKKVNFNHLQLDYGHWQKTGQKLYHINRHSDNFRAHFHWRKHTAVVVGKTLYRFVPARAASRALATVMLTADGHKRYQQHTPLPRHAVHQ